MLEFHEIHIKSLHRDRLESNEPHFSRSYTHTVDKQSLISTLGLRKIVSMLDFITKLFFTTEKPDHHAISSDEINTVFEFVFSCEKNFGQFVTLFEFFEAESHINYLQLINDVLQLINDVLLGVVLMNNRAKKLFFNPGFSILDTVSRSFLAKFHHSRKASTCYRVNVI